MIIGILNIGASRSGGARRASILDPGVVLSPAHRLSEAAQVGRKRGFATPKPMV
jgi:hypothetical protein